MQARIAGTRSGVHTAWWTLLGVALGSIWAVATAYLALAALFLEVMPRFRLFVGNAYLTPLLVYALARGWRSDGHGLRSAARAFLAVGIVFAGTVTVVLVSEF